MTPDNTTVAPPRLHDPVSDVLKWILLAVGIGCFAVMGWATIVTYQAVPPQPDRYVSARGALLMSGDDIVAGKAGFQKADLMDFGSLYGMGSYYGAGLHRRDARQPRYGDTERDSARQIPQASCGARP